MPFSPGVSFGHGCFINKQQTRTGAKGGDDLHLTSDVVEGENWLLQAVLYFVWTVTHANLFFKANKNPGIQKKTQEIQTTFTLVIHFKVFIFKWFYWNRITPVSLFFLTYLPSDSYVLLYSQIIAPFLFFTPSFLITGLQPHLAQLTPWTDQLPLALLARLCATCPLTLDCTNMVWTQWYVL